MVNLREYRHPQAERNTLASFLAELPEKSVVERMSLEARKEKIEQMLASWTPPSREPARACLTFHGKPVVGTHGIFADFGAEATKAFTNAVAAIGISQETPLKSHGKLPNHGGYYLLITKTALGSFGFELEEIPPWHGKSGRYCNKYLKASLDEKPGEYEAISEPDDPPTLTEWADQQFPGLIENIGKMSLPNLICNPEIGRKILGMKWWLWDFRGEKNHLLLADRPCIFTTGVADSDLVIVLPIGPWKAFMATKTERFANIMRQQRPKDLLIRMNESSLRQARERVYALDASPHRFICNRLIGQRERPPTS